MGARSRSRSRVSDKDRARLSTKAIKSAEIDPNIADLHMRQGDVLSVLDKLRATRKMRGGVGAPLLVPGHLRDAAQGKPAIIITETELKADESKR